MILSSNLVAPSPGQSFTGNPSGTSYTASSSGVISNVQANDVLALLKAGCTFQATGSGTSKLVLTLSQAGIVSDAPNGLDYGVTAPSGTGQEALIQAAINAAVTQAAALGVTGVRVVWDVAVALGGEIYLSSNTSIEAPDYGCGAIVRSGAKCPIFRVQGSQLNMGGGAYTGANIANTQNSFGKFNPAYSGSGNPQYYRVFDPAFVNANNLAITGGTWNANSLQQSPRAYGVQTNPSVVVANNIGWPCVMDFRGVNGLFISKARVFLGLQFGLYFVNCANVILDQIDADQVNDHNYDNDSIHFNGPCQHIRIYSPRVHCADDCIAINADDANFSGQGLYSGVNWSCSGAITDVKVHDAVVWNGRENTVSWGAVCFRSTVALIDDVLIDGISGVAQNWAIWAPQFGTGMLVPGPGNIGRVVIDNATIDLNSPVNSPSPIAWGLNTDSLVVRNRYRRAAQACPDIFIASGITVQMLDVPEYDAYQPAGATNNTQPAVLVAGTVNSLRMTGRSLRDSSLAASSAPLLRVASYSPNAAQSTAFPASGTGSIGFAFLDVDAEGITNVADITAAGGTIGTLALRGVHRVAGGGSPLANAGSVTNYIVGAGSFPLAYASGSVASYTGTAPAQINAYADAGAATIETPAIALASGTLYVQGGYTGGTPTGGTVSINGGAAQAIAGFSAASNFWYGTVTAPASAGNANTISVTLSTGGVASAPGKFATLGSGGTILHRSQFIAGTTGFASTLGAYTGSTNGDVNNAWNITTTGGTTTVIQPTIAAAGGGVSLGPLSSGSYYHNLTNINAHPVVASGWKLEMADVSVSNLLALGVLALHTYSDNVQNNTFDAAIAFNTNNCSLQFSNVVGGSRTNIGSAITFATFSSPGTLELINDGTNVTLYVNGTSVGSCAASSINAGLVSNSACTYVGWTSLSNASGQTVTHKFTSLSFGY